MIFCSIITFQNGEFILESSNILEFLATIIVAIMAAGIAFLSARFQAISLLQTQITEKAKECNSNIDPITHEIILYPQNISNVVSAIITTEQLIDKVIKGASFLFLSKQSLIDQFYLQLHTSIIEYIKKNEITPSFEDNIIKYHIELQLKYCNELFNKSIEKYGNATPKVITEQLNAYKAKRN